MIERDIPTTNIDLSHHIQRQIIMKLRQEGDRAYRALKPDGVEGNAFNYHLRNLKKAGLIELNGEKYTLTSTGYLVSDGFSTPAVRLMMRPYAHTALLITSGNKVLLYKAHRQPLKDIYGLPSGKMRYGDSIQKSIARELGYRKVIGQYDTSFICQTNVRFAKKGEVVIHRPGALWHVEYSGELKTSKTFNGYSDWFDIKEINTLSPLSPEVNEALQRIKDGSHEPIDIIHDLS